MMHDYYGDLAACLQGNGYAQPTLVLDLDHLSHNISVVKKQWPAQKALRIVDKSLPCLPLLDLLASAFQTRHLMSFHLPVASAVQQHFPDADVAFGKPMPVRGAEKALRERAVDPARTLWLIDTQERLAAYGTMAEQLGLDLHIYCEVDIGLHRGGFASPQALCDALAGMASYPRLSCHGLLGYEAHITHVPRLFGGSRTALRKASNALQTFAQCLGPHQRRIINVGGSTTALLYSDSIAANEIALGSAFVMPRDFDKPSLAALKPALFIATPVLKVVRAQVPGPNGLSPILRLLRQFPAEGCYLYGGKWMAAPVHPCGMKASAIMGLSTNQQFMALPKAHGVKPDDIALFRPTQSEQVMQLFSTLTVVSNGKIHAHWPILPVS